MSLTSPTPVQPQKQRDPSALLSFDFSPRPVVPVAPSAPKPANIRDAILRWLDQQL